jgi:hypothetical protein
MSSTPTSYKLNNADCKKGHVTQRLPIPYAVSKNGLLMSTLQEIVKIKMPEGESKQSLLGFAGNVGFSNVEKMVESTDTCVSARHVANMSTNMLATRPKTVSAEVLKMSSQHVTYGYEGNMSAYVGDMLAACNQVKHV